MAKGPVLPPMQPPNTGWMNIPELIKSYQQDPGGTHPDIARYILTHANVDWNKQIKLPGIADMNKVGKSGPSVISRIFDILSRGNYASAEAFNRLFQHEMTTRDPNTGEQVPINPEKHSQGLFSEIGDILHGAASGFAGTKKTTFSDVINTYNPDADKTTKFLGGLVGDIGLDPLTYVGPGLIKDVLKGGKALVTGSKDAAEAIPEAKGLLTVAPESAPKELSLPSETPLPPGLNRQPLTAAENAPNIQLPKLAAPIAQGEVPKVSLPANVTKTLQETEAKGTTVPQIKDLIKQIQQSSPYKIPKGFSKTRKADLMNILAEMRDTGGIKAAAEAVSNKVPEAVKELAPGLASKIEDVPKNELRIPTLKESTLSAEHYKNYLNKTEMSLPVVGAKDIAKGVQDGILHEPTSAVAKAIGDSVETHVGKQVAQRFARDILSKENKFPTEAGKAPAINNPAQQANLFERLKKVANQVIQDTKNIKYPHAQKFEKLRFKTAYNMMKGAEQHLESIGLHPTFWDGSHIKLTDVIDQLGGIDKMTKDHLTQIITAFVNRDPAKIVNPDVRQAIENLRASSALKEAGPVDLAVKQAAKQSSVAQDIFSPAKFNEFKEGILKQNKDVLTGIGTSPASVKSAQTLIRHMMQNNGTLPQLATEGKKIYIQRYMSGDKLKWSTVQSAQTHALEQTLGANTKSLGRIIGDGNRAADFFLGRLATWYGNKDLRPLALIEQQTAKASAAARAALWNNIAKTHTPEQISEAFKVAQGLNPASADSAVNDLSQQFVKSMESLFASSGVKDEAARAASVANRSGLLIDDINKQLEAINSPFRFIKGKVEDALGKMHDYSKGTDWLKSWETFSANDPLKFMWSVETALEQTMHKYSFLDEIGARWGSKARTKEFNTPASFGAASRLKGLYFPREIANQLDVALKSWNQVWEPKSPLLKFMDRVTSTWKTGVTIYAPSHHIRNFIGDVYMSWMAGVNNPAVYNTAARVLFSQKNRYKDLESIENLVSRDAISRAMTKPGDVVLRTSRGVDLTAEQIYIAAHNMGLLQQAHAIEDILSEPLIKAQPFGGKVSGAFKGWSENQEHYIRLAHFIDKIKKSKETNIQRMFQEAAKDVRKWHPDGMDLTDFERKYLRRIFPFYSWTRKAIPLVIESVVTNPGKTMVYPKAMQALQGMMGIGAPSRSDPFPQDQLFPDWIMEKGIGPIGRYGMGGIPGVIASMSRAGKDEAGNPTGYTVVNPSNPAMDLISQFAGMGRVQDPISGVAGMINPLFRVPAEVATGTTTQGIPISNDPNKYITDQIPLASMFGRMANMGVLGPTKRGQNEGMGNQEAFWNFLLGLGITGTGPYIKTAEFQQRGKK